MLLGLWLGVRVLNGLQQVCREAAMLWLWAERVELGDGGTDEDDENGWEKAGRWGRREVSTLEAARSCRSAGGMTMDTLDSDD